MPTSTRSSTAVDRSCSTTARGPVPSGLDAKARNATPRSISRGVGTAHHSRVRLHGAAQRLPTSTTTRRARVSRVSARLKAASPSHARRSGRDPVRRCPPTSTARPVGVEPVRPGRRLRVCPTRGSSAWSVERPQGDHHRRVRQPARRVRPRRLPTDVRVATVYDRERLLQADLAGEGHAVSRGPTSCGVRRSTSTCRWHRPSAHCARSRSSPRPRRSSPTSRGRGRRAVSRNTSAISNSYATDESPEDNAFEGVYDQAGIAVTASSGDVGYASTFPATSPHVIAVGATSLVRDASPAWLETRPRGAGAEAGAARRSTRRPGSSPSSPRTRAAAPAPVAPSPTWPWWAIRPPASPCYDSYGSVGGDNWYEFGGTSVGAPIVAALFASGQRRGAERRLPVSGPPHLRAAARRCSTSPSGSNGNPRNDCWPASPDPYYLCHAQVGYDGPTGLGTPNGLGGLGRVAPPAGAGVLRRYSAGPGLGQLDRRGLEALDRRGRRSRRPRRRR